MEAPEKDSKENATDKKQPARGGGNSSKFNFRTPQQFIKKKMWNNKRHHVHDVENLQNIKNQIRNTKQIYNNKKMVSHRNISEPVISGVSTFSVRSKFFLPDKRPQIIIPPTKFLLGGNISDPLNLNSLQDEAILCNNTTPTTTPRQSPITTPPKVEIYLPPNIHDPLHLLDPVDSIEYEKQLVSPMKRKTKHRHRKKKPKRRRLDSMSSLTSTSKVRVDFGNILKDEIATKSIVTNPTYDCHDPLPLNQKGSVVVVGETSTELVEEHSLKLNSVNENTEKCKGVVAPTDISSIDTSCCNENASTIDSIKIESTTSIEALAKEARSLINKTDVACSSSSRKNDSREKVKELKLELIKADDQQTLPNLSGRKRKISEGPGSSKVKFRRLDSMDKIVSPVVPQPGAWKRPPRNVPTGGRKGSRNRSTSVSESELISPTEENKPDEAETISAPIDNQLDNVESCPLDPLKSQIVEKIPPNVTITTAAGKNIVAGNSNNVVLPKRPNFKADGCRYQYGNYDSYSKYRNFNESMDVRLKIFLRNPDLFKNKDILDIGCNVGHMTIAVGRRLSPKSILGIDIDSKLISRARRNLSLFVQISKDNCNSGSSSELHKVVKNETVSTTTTAATTENTAVEVVTLNKIDGTDVNPTKKKKKPRRKKKRNGKMFDNLSNNQTEHFNLYPVSFPICYGGIPVIETINDTSPPSLTNDVVSNEINSFPKNVFFRQKNYVVKDEAMLNNDLQQYDIIMCLSVTKWIHLNFGDSGLKLAFKRMFNQLRPGGKLILEAQNWASYKKKKNLTETIYNNYRSIEFFPNKFHEYLLSNEVGFSHSFTLGVPRHLSKGFCRPIQLYAKGDFTPNHVQWSDAYHPQTPYVAYRGIYASIPRPPYPHTPRGHGNTSCFQTPMYQPGSQYYNPMETDSYLPSYDTEVLNRHYVFASPLYQTVWSPPASLRNSSSHTPVFGSVREAEMEEGQEAPRHVYPPNEESPSSQGNSGGVFSVREESEQEESPKRHHVYANCDSSSSPKTDSGDG